MRFDKNKLSTLRLQKGISICELSLETGVEKATLSRMENGFSKNPGFEVVAKLSRYFQVPMESFELIDLNPEKCRLSDDELLEKCKRFIYILCNKSNRTYTMPVLKNLKTDSEILFPELINRFEALKKGGHKLAS